MADATLGELYDAVLTALDALGPEGSGSFKLVADFGGELTPETLSQVVGARTPAALFAVAGEDPNGGFTVETTTGEFDQTVRTALVVYVAVSAVRGHRRASKDAPASGPKGLHTLNSEVIAALNGLYVEGLQGTARVHYAGMRSALWAPGNTGVTCVYALRFIADRPAEQVGTLPDDAYSPAGGAAVVEDVAVRGSLALEPGGAGLANVNPIASSTST